MRQRIALGGVSLAMLLSLVLGSPPTTLAASTFTVNRTGDASDLAPGNGKCDTSASRGLQCTLRAAIEEANAFAGADTIKFNIKTKSKVIKPATPLPAITQRLTINGYSQAGASANTRTVGDNAILKITVDGTNAAGQSGFLIQAKGTVIKGLAIQNFDGFAIQVEANNVAVTGNFIGTDATGVHAAGNGAGLIVADCAGLIVGGTTPAARNVISGNSGTGLFLVRTTGATIQGNYIGTDKNGTAALGNSGDGINVLDGGTVKIGGPKTNARNVISANSGHGIEIQNRSNHNTIQANVIGTSATGSIDLGNQINGITLIDSGNDTVGGAGQAGNAVFFNFNGIIVESANNTVSGNAIERNDQDGMFVQAGPNTIAGNAILANTSVGIFVTAGNGSHFSANVFAGNGGLAIDINGPHDSFGVTPNDTDDPDTGPNGLQNFPVLTLAHRASNGVTTIAGSLNSLHSTTFTIEFFVAAADPSGHGEGQIFLGSKSVTTNGGGDVSFSFATVVTSHGQLVTATATNATTGDTSEFSANVVVT